MGKERLRDVYQADNPAKARRRLDMSYDWFDQVDVSKLSRLGRIPDAEHGREGSDAPRNQAANTKSGREANRVPAGAMSGAEPSAPPAALPQQAGSSPRDRESGGLKRRPSEPGPWPPLSTSAGKTELCPNGLAVLCQLNAPLAGEPFDDPQPSFGTGQFVHGGDDR